MVRIIHIDPTTSSAAMHPAAGCPRTPQQQQRKHGGLPAGCDEIQHASTAALDFNKRWLRGANKPCTAGTPLRQERRQASASGRLATIKASRRSAHLAWLLT